LIKDKTPFVSVIVIVLNMEATIGSCLSALKKLNYPEDKYEIIVVDGGSTDNTLQVIKQFDVKLFSEASGIRGSARNYGINKAKGSIMAFIDADCDANREWLRLHVDDHLAHPDVGAVGGGIIHKLPKEGKFTSLIIADNETEFSVVSRMRYVSTIPTCNASFKKSVLNRVGLFNEKLHIGEDTEICHRIVSCGYKILFDPEASIIHRSVAEFWTNSDIHKLAASFVNGGMVYFAIERAQSKQKYRLPLNAFVVLCLFLPILLIRGLRILYKTRYIMSVRTLRQVPYLLFGSFFWTWGYFKEAKRFLR